MHRVLIVDDNRCHRETFGAALRLEGYGVCEADTAGCAIDYLAAHSPDAMFLDLRLPDKTGIDVLKWMRSVNRFVPTAVVTAFGGEFDPDEAIALGALAYADQPLSLEALLATARALVRPPCASSDPDDLHRRVMAGDPAALDRLVHICLRQLPSRLQCAFPREPWDLSVDAVSDACLFYATGGARRVPDGASVLNFLFKIAWRRLSDARRSAAARAAREQRWAIEQPTTTGPADIAQAFDVWGLIVSVTKDVRERRAAELWLDRATTDAIATALGAGHLPPADRGRTAKQFKDRLIKRLSRRLS
jgi:CheY-like chemotaxis protein/DNA-directed RNA polymerase specialized sigma24 family protein